MKFGRDILEFEQSKKEENGNPAITENGMNKLMSDDGFLQPTYTIVMHVQQVCICNWL